MSFGDPKRGTHEWTLGSDEARPLIKQALEAGITSFDTANNYSLGASEEIVGKVLGELAKRDEVIIATKVFARMDPGPKGSGLSRAALFTQLENSLKRLGTDYIDLYQIHRYDPNTPIEETMQAPDAGRFLIALMGNGGILLRFTRHLKRGAPAARMTFQYC